MKFLLFDPEMHIDIALSLFVLKTASKFRKIAFRLQSCRVPRKKPGAGLN